MFRRYFLITFLLLSAFLSGYSFRDLDWLKHESDHFVYLYHKEVASSIFQVEALAEDAFDTLSELFGNPFKEKITVIIGGYEDRSNGLANPVLESIYIMTVGMDYPYRNDGFWLEEVITHELTHLFQITSVTEFGNILRNYVSKAYLPNALQPMWLTEGFAQLGSELIGDLYEYDYRRLPFLLDQLMENEPFSEETVVTGFSGIGGESYYNYGYAFLSYLSETYGIESLLELVKVKRGLLGLTGIELAIKKVYGKSYEELKEEFIEYQIKKWEAAEVPFVYEFSRGVGEFVNHFRPKIYDGKLYYLSLDRQMKCYSLNIEGVEIFNSTMEIVDFAVFESEIALILFEEEQSETRLYFFREGKLERTKTAHLREIDYLGKDRLLVVRNNLGISSIEILSLRTERVTRIFTPLDPSTQIDNIRVSCDGSLIAFRINNKGDKSLAIYNSSTEKFGFFDVTNDFSIGGWVSEGFLISVKNEFGSDVYVVTSEGEMIGKSSFSRYVREPVMIADGVIAVGQLQGRKLLFSSNTKPTDYSLESKEIILSPPQEIEGVAYNGFSDWRFVSLLPFKGISVLFSDLTFRNKLLGGVSFDFETMLPGINVQLFSEDYLPVDFSLSLEYANLEPKALLNVYRRYRIDPKLSFGWKASLEYPLRIAGSLDAALEDSSALYGGQASLNTLINVRDTQTATSNLVDVGINVDFDWNKHGFTIDSTIYSRVTFGEEPSIVPVELWGFRDDTNIVVGFSLDSDYVISRRGLNVMNLVHFSEEGIGGKIDFLIGSRFSWRIAIYKFETAFLYAAYPMHIKAGIMLENTRLLPYLDFELIY
ncbi:MULTISPECIES: hypothetical protein [Mesotoga]|uniref:hypothetical protein n=1 Tax=Mesotoga TaxID=1184396 RepID=UPI0002CA383B|nr:MULTISPECIES: hypothetical protein [Mesotoga]MCP5457094.1 hypothetical protein [Thermotogota bacterium]CCU83894.1 conserved exported hypothetical protein [Mesotoga infera]MCP5460313.1 hypothetical protein [Thermotogota bacterium]RLL81764.1 hypothetical protein Y696_04270 [Mesotoga sp. H07pep.5.4]HNQ69694.1 hypothetical protein [Mesotoga prima]